MIGLVGCGPTKQEQLEDCFDSAEAFETFYLNSLSTEDGSPYPKICANNFDSLPDEGKLKCRTLYKAQQDYAADYRKKEENRCVQLYK